MNYSNTRSLLADVVRQKQERRRRLARLSFGEKIVIVEKLREQLQPLKNARILPAPAK